MIRCPYRLIPGAACNIVAADDMTIDVMALKRKAKKKRQLRPRRKRNANYPKIGRCAKALNVSRTHLWYVLEGIRKGRENLAEDYYRMVEEANDE